MKNKIDRELENSDNWDYERPIVREPVKAPRVVVSVAFHRPDFARVSQAAERSGMKTSEFIREAAIEKATGQGGATVIYFSGTPGAEYFNQQMRSYTRLWAVYQYHDKEPVPAVTN